MGTNEIILIFVIYLLLFGAKGIPSLAQTMGKAVRGFREASSDIQREIMNTSDDIKKEVMKNAGELNNGVKDATRNIEEEIKNVTDKSKDPLS
ncbi:MAG: twin-arginine translocase TatA/TatE family subunit [Flavobacteriales bacterium]|uniref:twin-arginine translocase TatA/TatE family subunit n=1 Tax=Sanyastnella coralliicola TaxID=3069118 RepID=UPI0027B97577|nr:twin-arginine translocase TatA/TatE family subunit [Longitalea sp. SCSIO 12813]MCH2198933.1 twin-arginine translocase TatA/TatE family subunit [Flavobacteriales bacterium]